MRFFIRTFAAVQLMAGLVFLPAAAGALTVDELMNVPNMTPEKFASYFADFKFKFHDDVQDHDTFLASKSGDCDDYATLAAEVLGKNGYTTRLIAVRMKGETHVVCYVVETRSYLDYNARKDKQTLIPCENNIQKVARKVADSFGRDWIATYEFSWHNRERVKRLVNRIISNRTVDRAS